MVSKVKQSIKNYNIFNIIVPSLLLAVILIVIINPQKYSKIAFSGLEVWVKVLVPTLFPFFVLTKLFSSCEVLYDASRVFKPITKKIYNCPAITAYVFLMSILTGYPVGSKLISDLYSSGQISSGDATKALSFCANSGPMFILGSVAIGMFNSPQMGYIILSSHILGSLINGLIYRNIKSKQQNTNRFKPSKISFSESINQSISSIFLIGGVICFTFVLIEVITSNILFKGLILFISKIGISENVLVAVFSGLCEITKGCLMLSLCNLSFPLATALCTFIISFGGISTFLQATAFTKGIVKNKTFLLQKFTHAIISTFISLIIILIL